MNTLTKNLQSARRRLQILSGSVEPEGTRSEDQKSTAASFFADSFDAVWQAIRAFLFQQLDTDTHSIAAAIQELFLQGCFSEEQNRAALNMLDARNQLSQDQRPEILGQVYLQLPAYQIQMEQWLDDLEAQLVKDPE